MPLRIGIVRLAYILAPNKNTLRFLLFQTGSLAVLLTSILIWPLIGASISKELLGQISLMLAVAAILAPALSCGIHLYLANQLASGRTPHSQVAAKLGIKMTYILLLCGCALLLVSLIPGASLAVYFSLSFVSSSFLVTIGSVRGLNKPFLFALFTFLVQVIGLLFIALGAWWSGSVLLGVFFYAALITLPVAITHRLLLPQAASAPLNRELSVLGKALKLVPHLVLAVALLAAIRVIVSAELGPISLAEYTFASLIIGATMTVGSSLDAHWSVRAQSQPTLEDLRNTLYENQRRLQLILLGLSVGVLVFLFNFLPLWLPPQYPERSIILAVLLALPAASLQGIADGRSAMLVWSARHGTVSFATAIGTAIAISMAYLLLRDHGWAIAGLCISLGALGRAICVEWACRRVSPGGEFKLGVYIPLLVQTVAAAVLTSTTLQEA